MAGGGAGEGSRQRPAAFEEGAAASPGLGSGQVAGPRGGRQQHEQLVPPEEDFQQTGPGQAGEVGAPRPRLGQGGHGWAAGLGARAPRAG